MVCRMFLEKEERLLTLFLRFVDTKLIKKVDNIAFLSFFSKKTFIAITQQPGKNTAFSDAVRQSPNKN